MQITLNENGILKITEVERRFKGLTIVTELERKMKSTILMKMTQQVIKVIEN